MSLKRSSALLAGAVAAAALAMLSAGNVHANLILNGKFSANAASYTNFPGYSTSPNPTAPADWSVNGGGAGVNGPDTGAAVGTPFAPSSTAGVNDFLFMQGGGIDAEQTVAPTANEAYTLSFAAAQRDGDTTAVLEVILLNGANGGNSFKTYTPAVVDTGFTNFSLNFTAPSDIVAVEFYNNSPAGVDDTVDVSNVSLAPTPVPEPATLGLLGIGSMGLLLLKRRNAS